MHQSHRVDTNRSLVRTIARVKVRRVVIIVEHRNHDPEESADFGHMPSIISRKPAQELSNPIQPLINLLHVRREAEPHVRVEAAVVAGDDGDVVVLEQGG